ncbi:MAG: aminopeptidase P family protein [Bacteroidota bacterium]|nr:aminopeptidase P family protein [Bacteroidota bacterium]
MNERSYDAYIIGSADPHQSEYVPEHWMARGWISGFTGSAGTALVTADHVGIWTDARYFLQAEMQILDSEVVLHKLKVQAQAEYLEWLGDILKEGQVVACDFQCFSLNQIEMFDKILSVKNIQLKDSGDILNDIWIDRPLLPTNSVFEHDIKYAGKSREEKLNSVKLEMTKKNAQWMLVPALDEIAYILNLRGSDVACNPVFLAYLAIGQQDSILFINPEKVNPEIQEHLKKAGVILMDYFEITEWVKNLPADSKVLLDTTSLNAKLSMLLPQGSIIPAPSCIMHMKAQKNETEIAHIRHAMAKDGAALVKSFMWLEDLLNRDETCSEYEFSQQLTHFRKLQEGYVGDSFDAIVGYQSNGAIIHYRPEKETAALIQMEGILLVDSGGQYVDGTTDITRTIALSPISDEIKKQYTAVLMGNMALSSVKFPEGTKGIQLDILARQYLWDMGLNFGHGTGHGVGFFMNVHEPPQGFVTAWNQRGSAEMLPGMLTSNEPGFYKEGSHGIRIENLVLNVLDEKTDYGNFLRFDVLTVFPIDTRLIDFEMFGQDFREELNAYHNKCYNQISPLLNENERSWLKEKCVAV